MVVSWEIGPIQKMDTMGGDSWTEMFPAIHPACQWLLIAIFLPLKSENILGK